MGTTATEIVHGIAQKIWIPHIFKTGGRGKGNGGKHFREAAEAPR